MIENEKLANFLKTTTAKTALYYLPEKLTDDMKNTIKEQKEKALEARKDFESRMNYQDVKKRRGESEDEEEEEEEGDGRRGGGRRRSSVKEEED